MQGRKQFTPQLFYHTSLESLVPKDNYYRILLRELDLHYLYACTSKYYGSEGQYCEDKNIDAYIPNFDQYKPEREGFIYNVEKEQYECVQEGGNKAILFFKGIRTDSKGYEKKTYRSSEKDCKDCPVRAQCCGKVSKFKKLDDSIHKPLYDKMHKKLTENKSYHRRLVKRRSSTVEPVLGTLINHHNMKRINSRGLAQANKHVLMAALTYNLNKYLKFIVKKPLPITTSIVQILSQREGNNLGIYKASIIP